MTFVAELNMHLADNELAIYEHRSGLSRDKEDRYIARWKGQKLAPPKELPVTCPELGGLTGETVGCRNCPTERLDVYTCARHGKTVLSRPPTAKGVQCCKHCPDNPANVAARTRTLAKGFVAPTRKVRIEGLPVPKPSNATIIRWNGRLLLAYRTQWSNSQVAVCTLDEDFRPGPSTILDLRHDGAVYGQEDPRWFVHGDRLYVAYAGVIGPSGPTNQLYARLRDDLTVERIWQLRPGKRNPWMKNINFFSHGGELFAVDTISPHHILRVDEDGVAESAHLTKNARAWTGGPLRGGASPVRVGNEYVSWFHGKLPINKMVHYNCGVYKFRAEPPFEVTWQMMDPIAWGDPMTRPTDWPIANWFVCGAILEDGKWLVSGGVHDAWIEIVEWSASAIDRAMGIAIQSPGQGDSNASQSVASG